MRCHKIQVRDLDNLKRRAERLAAQHGISVSVLCGTALRRSDLESIAVELATALRRIDWRGEVLKTLRRSPCTLDELCERVLKRVNYPYPHRIMRVLSGLIKRGEVSAVRSGGMRKYHKR